MAYDFGTEGEENAKLGQRGACKNMQMMRQGIGASKPGERQHASHCPNLGRDTGGDQQYRDKVFKYPSGRQAGQIV
jgi:hypothetical protein